MSDIVFAVNLVSRFMSNPSKLHFIAAKRILRYLSGTKKLGIKYVKEEHNSLIAMSKNPVFHSRTKHIELRHHFIRDLVNDGEIQLEFISTNDQMADIFTKGTSSNK